jgi:zinc/manganese transport system substrate-binding protein
VRGQKLVAYHKSFSYLADWLGLDLIAHVEPKPGIPPNPGHVAQLITLAKSEGVRVLLQESWFPAKTSDLVAEKIGARVVTVPGGPDLSKGESYADFVEKIVKALEKGFAK